MMRVAVLFGFFPGFASLLSLSLSLLYAGTFTCCYSTTIPVYTIHRSQVIKWRGKRVLFGP